MIVLYIMSSGTPEENLKQIFRVFDINNDGKISLKELQKIVRDLFLLLNEAGIVKASQDAKASQDILVKTGKYFSMNVGENLSARCTSQIFS